MRTRRNNRKLYETIMTRVARQVKKALNEDGRYGRYPMYDEDADYEYDELETDTPLVQKVREALKNSRNIGIYEITEVKNEVPNVDVEELLDAGDRISLIIYDKDACVEPDGHPCVCGEDDFDSTSENKFLAVCRQCRLKNGLYLYDNCVYDCGEGLLIIFLDVRDANMFLR